MPKRSNEFQRILTAVHSLYAPQGAKVTASAMLKSPTGEEREVDILVEIPTNLFTVKVGIEAKDHGRKLDNTDIDAIKGKFSDLPVREVIVVARGFTGPARTRATAYGIKCQTVETLESEAKGTFNRTPPVAPAGSHGESKGDKIRWGLWDVANQLVDRNLAHNGIVHDRNGKPLGKALDIARHLRPDFPDEVKRARQQREGCFVKGELIIRLENYKISDGEAAATIGRISISTSSLLIIPDLKATAHTIRTETGEQKEVIAETASNEFGHYTIVHEKSATDDSPKKIHVHFTDKQGAPTVQKFTYKIELELH